MSRLQACVSAIRVPESSNLSVANQLYYPNGTLAKRHTLEWFPMGFRTIKELIDLEFLPYEKTGITSGMLSDAAVCCPWCARVSVVRNRLSTAGNIDGKAAAIVKLLTELHAEKHLPDVQLVLATHDIFRPPDALMARCAGKVLPILSHANSQLPSAHAFTSDDWLGFQRGVLSIPENTFYQTYGARHPANWDADRLNLLANQTPWSARDRARLYFRGSGSGYRHFLNISRRGDVDLSPEMRFKFFPSPNAPRTETIGPSPPFVAMHEQCKEKYLVHLPGTWPSISNKLKSLLACGAVVLMPQNNWYEFWYPLLQPFVHFVPTKNLAIAHGRDLPGVLDCLIANEEEAERIALAARAFVREVLTLRLNRQYLRALVQRFRAAMVRGGAATGLGAAKVASGHAAT
jgi:protein glucosyltransferase